VRFILEPDAEDLLIARAWVDMKKATHGFIPLDTTVREAVNALIVAWWDDTVTAMQEELQREGISWLPGQEGLSVAEWSRKRFEEGK